MRVEPLSPLDEAALGAGSAILCEAFGPTSFPPDRLLALASEPGVHVLIARDEAGTVTALGMARIVADLRPFAPFGSDALAVLRARRVGSLESSAVAADRRGSGIGRLVALRLIEWLVAERCDLAAAAAWASGGLHTSRPLLEKLGFRAIADLPGEVHRIENLGGRPCPVCGAPCRCSGTLLLRDLP